MVLDDQINNATPQFIGALTEMVWSQIGTLELVQPKTHTHTHIISKPYHVLPLSTIPQESTKLKKGETPPTASTARDLETFAKHGGRSIVKTEDVLLLARRNEGLEDLLNGFVENLRVSSGKGKKQAQGRGRGGVGRGAGAGAGAAGTGAGVSKTGRGRGRGKK